MTDHQPDFLEKIATMGYSLAASAGYIAGVNFALVNAGTGSVGPILASFPFALAAGCSAGGGVGFATTGIWSEDSDDLKISRYFSTGSLAAAALSLGIYAAAQQNHTDQFEGLLENPVTAKTEFDEHASASQQKPRILDADTLYVLEFEAPSTPGASLT